MSGVALDKRGPIFDGRAEKAVADACDSTEKRIATLGASMLRSRMNRVFKKQTPFYRLKVVAREDAPGWKITDQGVVYGAWLEGIGSRNAPVTRFKGYHSFRIIRAELDGRAKAIGENVMVEYLGKL